MSVAGPVPDGLYSHDAITYISDGIICPSALATSFLLHTPITGTVTLDGNG
jgi:hypothetical protein